MTKLKITTLAAALLSMGMGLASTAVVASDDDDDGGSTVIKDDLTRRPAGTTSGSGDTVEANCPTDPSGNDWQGATGTFKLEQEGSGSVAKIKVKNAVPNTVFTVWLRMKGSGPGDDLGNNTGIGGSPMTTGGATPLAPGSALDGMLHYSPPYPGTSNPTNGFTTDSKGNASFTIALDFPVVGGAYPFQAASDQAVTDLRAAGSTWPLVRIPSPVVNPLDANIGAGFLIRVISHCTDQQGHGLSPSTREAWFQYP